LSRTERGGRNGQRVQFSFRYDPADIGCLALFRDGAWVGDVFAKQLRQPDGSVLPLSLAERQLAQSMARRAGQSPRDWLRYIQDIDALNQTRHFERQRARRRSVTQGLGGPACATSWRLAIPEQKVVRNQRRRIRRPCGVATATTPSSSERFTSDNTAFNKSRRGRMPSSAGLKSKTPP